MAKYKEPLPDTEFARRVAEGHRLRLGHSLEAFNVSDDGMLWHTVRTCCGDTEPETVPTFG